MDDTAKRYEQRAFNFAYRIVGSETAAVDAVQAAFLNVTRRPLGVDDREPAFRTHLFTATRNACYDLMHGRQDRRPSETILEEGNGVREAGMRLPEHQREALALRGLEELSYDEIATIMEIHRNSVAQLISRARINLHDELRGNVLASVAAPSPECERALPLIAARDDGQLEAASGDATWLDAHLTGCNRCQLGVEVMQEAAASYRTWAPIAAPRLLEETTVLAAELAPGTSGRAAPSAGPGRRRTPRRRLALAAGPVALLLLAGVAAAVFAGDDPPATPADDAAVAPGPGVSAARQRGDSGEAKEGAAKRNKTSTVAAEPTVGETSSAPALIPTPPPTGGGGGPSEPSDRPNRPPDTTAHKPTPQTATPKPSPKPRPAPAPQPSTAPAPTAEQPPPAEEAPKGPPGQSKPPGKPIDVPPIDLPLAAVRSANR